MGGCDFSGRNETTTPTTDTEPLSALNSPAELGPECNARPNLRSHDNARYTPDSGLATLVRDRHPPSACRFSEQIDFGNVAVLIGFIEKVWALG